MSVKKNAFTKNQNPRWKRKGIRSFLCWSCSQITPGTVIVLTLFEVNFLFLIFSSSSAVTGKSLCRFYLTLTLLPLETKEIAETACRLLNSQWLVLKTRHSACSINQSQQRCCILFPCLPVVTKCFPRSLTATSFPRFLWLHNLVEVDELYS